MTSIPGLNDPNTGVVTANSFNLTRVTAALSLLIGGATVVGGAIADSPSAGDPLEFDSRQRLVIIVAVITAWAIVTSADIIGRAVATGRAEAARGMSAEASVIPLKRPQRAQRHDANAVVQGKVYALRGGLEPQYLFAPNDGDWEWLGADRVTFTGPA